MEIRKTKGLAMDGLSEVLNKVEIGKLRITSHFNLTSA